MYKPLVCAFIHTEEKGYCIVGVFNNMETAQKKIVKFMQLNASNKEMAGAMPYYVLKEPPPNCVLDVMFVIQDPTRPPEYVVVVPYEQRLDAWRAFAQQLFFHERTCTEVEYKVNPNIKEATLDSFRISYVENDKKVVVYPWNLKLNEFMSPL